MAENKSEILQGTLDLMALKTLEAMGRCTDMASPAASSKSVKKLCG
jgi:hypothetical protein